MEKIRKKNLKELSKMIQELRSQINEKYLHMRVGKVQDLREPRKMRKDLARLLTVYNTKAKNKLKDTEDGK